ncbi:MAG TPA: SGNH/GDSL hydrolase family protein [Gemmataceae bacterium]|jgi:lysophospholipase L1-like esterase|nr:SGNH/GDSL hydrolase family protein [Gemmataceae bacterium]
MNREELNLADFLALRKRRRYRRFPAYSQTPAMTGMSGMSGMVSSLSAPAQPSSITAFGANGQAAVAWPMVANATSYDVQSSSDNTTWTTISSAQTGTTYLDSSAATTAATTGLAYYRVRAKSLGGNSGYSNGVPASPTNIIFDQTNDANGTLVTAHSPNINLPGGVYTNPSASGSNGIVLIESNQFNASGGNGTPNGYTAVIDPGIQNITITGVLTAGVAATSVLVFRFVDANHYWAVGVDSSTGNFDIIENNDNIFTVHASVSLSLTSGTQYTVSATVLGSNITAYLNGTNQLIWQISGSFTGALTATKCGIRLAATDCFATKFGVAPADPLISTLTWLRGVAGFTAATWTDQTFQGNNATQGTGAQQAALATNALNGQSVVQTVDNARIMNLPSIQPTTGSFTKLALFKSSDLTQSNNLMSGTYTANSHVFWLNAGQFPESAVFSSETPILQLESTIGVGSPQTAWCLAMLTVFHSVNPNTGQDTWQSHWYINGQCGGISLTFNETAPSSNTISVLGLQSLTTVGFVGEVAELLLAADVPTAAQANSFTSMVNTLYGLSFPLFTKQVLFIGDSITTGFQATTAGGSWDALIAKNYPARYYVNKGRSGAFTSDLLGDIATNLYPFVSCGVPTACTVWAGTNDIDFGSKSGATAYANLVTICQELRAKGAGPIVVITMLPRGSADETQRQILNNALRSNWTTFADGLADVETMASGMGAAGANSNTTWYNADAIHPNDTGHALLYTLISGVLAPLW